MAERKKKKRRIRAPKPEVRYTLGTYKEAVTREELQEYMDWMLLGACKGYPVQAECLMGEMAPDDYFGWILAVARTFLDVSKWDSAYTIRQLDRFGSLEEAVATVWSFLPTEQPADTTE